MPDLQPLLWTVPEETGRVLLTQQACEVGVDLETCSANERCAPPPGNTRSRNGVCVCRDGYARDSEGRCVDKGQEERFFFTRRYQ